MKNRDLVNLLNRAAATLEVVQSTGCDVKAADIAELIEDLLQAATDCEYEQGRVVEEIED